MSVRSNAEGYFQEYSPVEIPYQHYSVRDVVARQHRESASFFREQQEVAEPEPKYPPLRDIGTMTDSTAAREVLVHDAVVSLVLAKHDLADCVAKVGRLARPDMGCIKRHIDRLGNYMRTLERRGRG